MEQPADSLPSGTSPSFASLLATLTSPANSGADQRSARGKNELEDNFGDGLEDDVTTLSYESALRANARYKPDHSYEWNLPQRIESTAALVAEEIAARAKAAEGPGAGGNMRVTAPAMSSIPDATRRRASVTVRLSEVECAQLQKRAAEAGLTVSAYLRSCTFEAEALRAQVKAALAELRAARPAVKNEVAARASRRNSWWEWLSRLLPQWHFGRRVARA